LLTSTPTTRSIPCPILVYGLAPTNRSGSEEQRGGITLRDGLRSLGSFRSPTPRADPVHGVGAPPPCHIPARQGSFGIAASRAAPAEVHDGQPLDGLLPDPKDHENGACRRARVPACSHPGRTAGVWMPCETADVVADPLSQPMGRCRVVFGDAVPDLDQILIGRPRLPDAQTPLTLCHHPDTDPNPYKAPGAIFSTPMEDRWRNFRRPRPVQKWRNNAPSCAMFFQYPNVQQSWCPGQLGLREPPKLDRDIAAMGLSAHEKAPESFPPDRPGERLQLHVDMNRAVLIDPQTELVL
jgi:hypothetical protein